MPGVIPLLAFPSDVAALQARLKAAAMGTDQSVRACGQLDVGMRASWGDFYIQLLDFCAAGTGLFGGHLGQSYVNYERGQQLETELYAWQTKLSGVCALTTPLYNPQTPDAPSDLGNALRWLTIAGVAVAGAYVVGKVVEIIPKGRGR